MLFIVKFFIGVTNLFSKYFILSLFSFCLFPCIQLYTLPRHYNNDLRATYKQCKDLAQGILKCWVLDVREFWSERCITFPVNSDWDNLSTKLLCCCTVRRKEGSIEKIQKLVLESFDIWVSIIHMLKPLVCQTDKLRRRCFKPGSLDISSLYFFFTTLVNAWACQSHDQLPFSLNLNTVNKYLHCAIPIDPFNSNGCTANFVYI